MGRPSRAPTAADLPTLKLVPKPAQKPYAMNTKAAAAYVGISETSLRRAIYAGELPSRKSCDGGVHLIQTVELEEWFHRLPPYFTDTGD